jgi:hypothetical protein
MGNIRGGVRSSCEDQHLPECGRNGCSPFPDSLHGAGIRLKKGAF